ncbi:hypothetical protein JYU34_004454 [Plutella xylostella]|uniref:FLYWCH-type domain-containing protein n=1 Tax=Plutella xylostella TaxID=51655 RepID=A0ABQ7QY20_PLUXY|nr:hypothetical protein JYU34_004454 [Plutella xylostella]
MNIPELKCSYSRTKYGNPVIEMGGYRYNRVHKRMNGPRARWTCVKNPAGCRAYLVTIDDHKHRGLVVGRHRYNLVVKRGNYVKDHWRCVKRNTGCRAVVHTLQDVVVMIKENHNHP